MNQPLFRSALFRTGLWLSALTGVIGCTPNSREVRLQAFDQPSDLAFVCFEATAGEDGVRSTLPLENCNGGNESLHILVTQVRRGELATVDLSGDGSVLDLDSRIPGFTFVEVGELPSAVVAPPSGTSAGGGPTFVYVASRGSRQITIVPVERLIRTPEGLSPTIAPAPLPLVEFGAIADLVLGANGDRLFAAMPEAGVVLEISIADGGGTLSVVGAVPLTVDPVPDPVPATRPAPYCQSCAPGLATVTETCENRILDPWPAGGVLEHREPRSLGATARPVAFAVDDGGSSDPSDDRVLVADANLPIVHVLSASTGAVQTPLPLSVPTTSVAVTPAVPATVGSATCVRYLYAIDAIDRSVLVADYPSAEVQAVGLAPGETIDRLTLPAGAQALEVFTVGDSVADVACPEGSTGMLGDSISESIGPGQFHGVFVAITTADGFVRFIDLRDLDAERGRSCGDDPFFVYRHRPRLNVSGDQSIELSTSPRITRELDTDTVADDGTTDLELNLGVVACDAAEQSVFGDESRICATGDPWAIRNERWDVVWEGPLPFAAGVRGRFLDDGTGAEVRFRGEVDFCELGTLGERNGAALAGEAYRGDLLVLTGPVSPAFTEECRARFFQPGLEGEDEVAPVAIRIVDTFADGVVLDASGADVLFDARTGTATLSDVIGCFGAELAGYEVRAGDRYTVIGATSGFASPVVATTTSTDPDLGAPCVVDGAAAGAGRASHGLPFVNGRVRFAIQGNRPSRGSDVALTFALRNAPEALVAGPPTSLGVRFTFPVNVAYNPLDRRLYVLDIQDLGLVPYTLEPLRSEDSFQ